ncbi:MAG: hypothetical protein GXP26_15855 [Planctomycetes bacterium]|nr:hypothetical protein [Planctomycetota bacterium]
MLYRFNLLLAFVLVMIMAMLVLFRVDNSQPNYQVIIGDDMTYTPAYTTFSKNSNFANGRTLQDPVPGTIARDTQLFHFGPTPQDALRAGEELANPFDLSTKEGVASADRGTVAFRSFCIACHGADGTGNGPVAKRGFPPPPSLLVGKSREMKDGQLFHILTYGQNSMPQFAAQLPPDRRWDVINHIRRLQQKAQQKAKSAAESAATAPDSEAKQEEAPKTEQKAAPEEKQKTAPKAKPKSAPEVKEKAVPEEKKKPAPEGEKKPAPEAEKEATSVPETSKSTQPDSDSPTQVDTETQP